MASLREAARSVLDDARDGVCWIVIWKTGRSWNAEVMYGVDYTEGRSYPKQDEKWDVELDDVQRLVEIMNEDPDARLVNGYYTNLGSLEEMTLASLMDGIRFQYGFGGNIEHVLRMAFGEAADRVIAAVQILDESAMDDDDFDMAEYVHDEDSDWPMSLYSWDSADDDEEF